MPEPSTWGDDALGFAGLGYAVTQVEAGCRRWHLNGGGSKGL
jgi:hypothetical protein